MNSELLKRLRSVEVKEGREAEDKLIAKILKYNKSEIVKVINSLGVESLCGVSKVTPEEVQDFLPAMQEYELGEILSGLHSLLNLK